MNFKLMQHQVDAVDFIHANTKYPGTLLWHEMGLGKTLSTLIAIRTLLAGFRAGGAKSPKVLAILPKSILYQWKCEVQKFTPDIYYDFVFIPYSQLNKAASYSKFYDFRVLVLDESHYMKTQGTNRMEDFCALLNSIGNNNGMFLGGRYLMLSGTPMPNHAAELYTSWALLTSSSPFDAIARMKDEKRYEKWRLSFTQIKTTSWETRYSGRKYGKSKSEGTENEELLQQLIGPVVHFRRAKDCIDLPESQDIVVNLGLQDDKLLKDADIDRPDAYMAVLERLARAKTPHAIEWIADFKRQSQEQLIVFCPYKFPLKEIAQKHKGCVFVTGEESGSQRNESVRKFVSGEARFMLTTYKAGGVGYNWQHAFMSLYLGYPWTPGDIAQAKARTDRTGQRNKTRHYFLISGENDSRIFGLICRKADAIAKVEETLSSYQRRILTVDDWV